MTQTVFLVRHGAPDKKGFTGRYDLPPGPPLSDEGREHAEATGQFLGAQGVTRLYHSPMARALQTSALIASELGLPSRQADEIIEQPRGELRDNLLQRVESFWEKRVLEQPDETVAAVSHGAPIEYFLQKLTGSDTDADGRKFLSGTPLGGVWRLERLEDASWHVTLAFDPSGIIQVA
ncbi:MAG: histidine phosphatase family protein [Anaerolineales bacterium]|nr:histidine phosphatase family protein [Anaerolineales bacterium]MCB0014323.1 histidine phosphatase family protein [Anaerolineales bacterium]